METVTLGPLEPVLYAGMCDVQPAAPQPSQQQAQNIPSGAKYSQRPGLLRHWVTPLLSAWLPSQTAHQLLPGTPRLVTTQLAFSPCPVQSLILLHVMAKIQIIHTDSCSSTIKARFPEFSKATEVFQFPMLTLVRRRKTSHTFFLYFLFLIIEPHLSKRRNPSSSSFLETGTEALTGRTEGKKKKEKKVNPVLSEHFKSHSTTSMAGGSVHLFCHALESRMGNEISCLMVQLLKAQALMSCYHKHSRKEKRKRVRVALREFICINYLALTLYI